MEDPQLYTYEQAATMMRQYSMDPEDSDLFDQYFEDAGTGPNGEQRWRRKIKKS